LVGAANFAQRFEVDGTLKVHLDSGQDNSSWAAATTPIGDNGEADILGSGLLTFSAGVVAEQRRYTLNRASGRASPGGQEPLSEYHGRATASDRRPTDELAMAPIFPVTTAGVGC
jgi:hypothetical protein